MTQDENIPDKCNYHACKAVANISTQTKHHNHNIVITLIKLYSKLAKLYMHQVWKHMSE